MQALQCSSGGVQIVFHPTATLCEASGFSKGIYAAHKPPCDIRCNTAYFDDTVDQVWTRLQNG
jgi:hypothetical protein